MYCASCGKENPQGAAFCAFCGKKLVQPQDQDQAFIEGELIAPEETTADAPVETPAQPQADPLKASRPAPSAHQAYMRPDPSRLVTPLGDNPAQPLRRSEARRARAAEAKEEAPADDLDEVEAPEKAPQTPPRREGAARRPAPKRETPPPRRAPRPVNVDAAGRPVPERKAPVVPRKKADWAAPNTLVPRRKKRPAEDLFFEDVAPGDDFEEEDERLLGRRIKSAAAAIFLLAALGFVFWLLVLPGGQMLCARMGVGAPASAYAALGEQYLAEGSMKRAADSYYDALRRDPDNYDYALRVAQTQALVGDRETALTAYAKCMSLRPSEAEPYRAVAELYQQMGQDENARVALKTGYDRTGDLELFRAYEAMMAGTEDAQSTSE